MKNVRGFRLLQALEFTPLEFETNQGGQYEEKHNWLEFTPLEFETPAAVYIYNVIFKLEFTPLEFETLLQICHSVRGDTH